MPLISNGEVVADNWNYLDDEFPLPSEGDVVLTLARLEREQDAVARRTGKTGVELPNSADPEDLSAHLANIDLVILRFPAFTDGRAYSQARVLRKRLGYEGEIRAAGNVLADQAAFMIRCGFDSFETDGRQPPELWRRAARAVTRAYQRGYEPVGGLAVRQGTAPG
ncbi:MAG: DUF934 domain-containing protein [Pseudomonadota bacterium]|nr:DUF934 domain-containing protein [Pseudomonadota bacterium]